MISKWTMRLLIGLFCTIIVAYFAIWLFSPLLVRHFGNQALATFGLSISQDSSVRYNPFLSRLSVDNLALYQQQKQVFAIANAALEVDLHKLYRQQAYLKALDIKGLRLEIAGGANGFLIAGFHVGNDAAPEQPPQPKDQQPLVLPYRLLAPLLTVKDAVIHFKNNQTEHLVEVKNFSIQELDIDQSRQQAKIALLMNIAQGSVAIDSHLDIQDNGGKLIGKIKLSRISVSEFNAYLPKPVKSVEGLLSVDLNTKIDIESASSAGDSDDIASDLSQLMPKSIHIDGEMSLNKWRALSFNKGQVLTQWDSLAVKGMQANLLFVDVPKTLTLGVGSMTLNNISSSDVLPETADLPPLSIINQLQVSGLSFENGALAVDKVTVDGMYNNIIIGQDKTVKTLVVITDESQQAGVGKPKPAPSAVPEDQPGNTDQDAFHFIIKDLLLNGENVLYFRDESVQPIYERTLYIDKLQATNLSNRPGQRADFSLTGRSNTYAKMDLSGYIYPFSDKANFHLEGDIKEVDLPPVSSYLRESLGFELKSGDLDLAINVTATESELNGETKLSIRGLETSSPQTLDTDVLQKATPLSLNSALNFLKDKRGNITLDVPMQGSVNDPDFGVNSLIKLIAEKAARIQFQRYMLTFVPYSNVITIAMKAGDMILELRFADLLYAPGQVTLEQEQMAYMEQFTELMKAKPKVQVKICGFATAVDLTGQRKSLDPAALTPEQMTDLRAMAQERSENFKAYAVNKGKLDSSRLLICNPQVDLEEGAEPRIEISV